MCSVVVCTVHSALQFNLAMNPTVIFHTNETLRNIFSYASKTFAKHSGKLDSGLFH